MPLVTKVLNRINGLFLGLYECSFPTRCERFNLFNHTSMIVCAQSRLPCRAVQLGEAVLLKKPVLPMLFSPRISHFLLKLYMWKNKVFAAKTCASYTRLSFKHCTYLATPCTVIFNPSYDVNFRFIGSTNLKWMK
jgi:hypothetical protein